MFALRKDVYGQFDPIPFYDHIVKMVEAGKYDKESWKNTASKIFKFSNVQLIMIKILNFRMLVPNS
ncbi:aerobic ribonucleotide reductase large subunit [Klebsiella phage CPRSA]|nr:aerobic ribonucleotide reductase large subunit [Klebsiella phage CPRSA]